MGLPVCAVMPKTHLDGGTLICFEHPSITIEWAEGAISS